MRKAFYIFIVLVIVSFIAFIGFIKWKEDDIKQQAISAINTTVDTEIEVKGKVDITFFSTFPKVSLTLNEVLIQDKLRVNDTLAYISTVHASFNALNIIRENYVINSIRILNGQLNLYTDQKGLNNFDILKSSSDTSSNPSSIDLNFIKLQKINFQYINEKEALEIETFIDNTDLAGTFSGKNFQVLSGFELYKAHLSIDKDNYLVNKNLEGKINISYQAKEDCYTFSESEIYVNKTLFNVKGNVCTDDNSIDMVANASGKNIKNSLNLVPAHFLNNQENIEGTGAYTIDCSITGKLNKPSLVATFSLNNGTITIPNKNVEIKEVSVNGFYNSNKALLKIEDYHFSIDNSTLHGKADFPNLKTPAVNIDCSGLISYSTLNRFTNENFSFTSGKVKLKDALLSLNYLDKDSLWKVGNIQGEIMIDNLSGNVNQLDKPFTINSELFFSNREAVSKKLDVSIGQNDLSFVGNLSNYLGYFSLQGIEKKSTLTIDGRLESNSFNLNDFLKKENTETKKESKKNTVLFDWLNLQGSIQLKLNRFKYDDFELENISAIIQPKPTRVIRFNNVNATFKEGNISGILQTVFSEQNDLELNIDSRFYDIDVYELFKSFNDFNQTAITHKNVKGKLDADILMTSKWENLNRFSEEDLFLDAAIRLRDGELIELNSLRTLSGKLSVEQLEHLYFDELESSILIKDRTINLPATSIKSNLLALEVTGSHSFDNDINYAIKLNLKNLLAAKFKKKKTLDENYINNTVGGINIFISMTGNTDNPIVKYDKKAVKNKIKKDFKNEKQELKGLFKKDTFEAPKNGADYLYFEEDTVEYLDW